jgi:hypothetical protein
MCINQGVDVTAPIVNVIGKPEWLMNNATNQNVFIYTNEPADCRWDYNDSSYNLMKNSFYCRNNIEEITMFGYFCNSTFEVNKNVNSYYIRCKDQPWLAGTSDESERNANQESFSFELKRTEGELKIDSVSPEGEIEKSTSMSTIDFQVETVGGAPNPVCYYSFSGYENMVLFFETYSNIHKQDFNLVSSAYKIYIKCEDSAGYVAKKEIDLDIITDSSSPQITRIWQSGGVLSLITSESADCVYSANSCKFDFDEGNSMGFGLVHETNVEKGKTYYIKCKDEFGNLPSGCSITVVGV